MKLYVVRYHHLAWTRTGYIRAKSIMHAETIAKRVLNKDCEILSITKAVTDITPQSLTLNFRNTTEYKLHG